MKKLLLGVFVLALFASCETDSLNVDNQDESVDLKTLAPNVSFNNSSKGMYAGIIVADQNEFHGKLWINVANNGKYSAMIETIQKDRYFLSLVEESNGIYSYRGKIGSFDFDPSNLNNTTISNVVISGTAGVARVLKETSQTRMMAILGTYDDAFGGTGPGDTGTWNFMAPDQGGADFNFIDEVIITTTGNHMIIEDFTTFENSLGFGCITFGGPVPPIFANYPNTDDIPDDPLTPDVDESAARDFAIFATNQTLPTGVPNKTIVYDVSFSQDLADFNGLDYNRFLGFPDATNNFFFVPPIDPATNPCNNIAGRQGLFAIVDDGGVAVGGGNIFIDVSGLTPPPAPLLPNQTTINTVDINF